MIVLVINAGSSSLKYQLYDMTDETVLAKGSVERIGFDAAIISQQVTGKPELRLVNEILDHNDAIKQVLQMLTDEEHGVIRSMEEINAVGHRVVHGGEVFSESSLVNDEVKEEIKRLFDLAPLHNPANLKGITAVEQILPNVPQAVVFDTAFHQSMPQVSYLYPIPRVIYTRHKVRRYGFHGTSHEYVSQRAAQFLQKPLEQLKMITCHIGNGISCTAIKDGKSFDTSMGMTPLEGVMMGTRTGDLDPALVTYIMGKEDLNASEINSMMNRHSGLLGVSGLSSDLREVIEAMEEGDRWAKLAFDMYEYRIRKYIGAYAAAMNGVDVIVFTAGAGENSTLLRKQICEHLTYLGVHLDEEANEQHSREERRITTADSPVQALVIPTNEELVIARDTYRLVTKLKEGS